MGMFFYKRTIKGKKGKEGEEDTPDEVVNDCINPEFVIMGVWHEGKFVLLCNDGREQAQDMQKPKFKGAKQIGWELKRERNWVNSEIPLDREDARRWRRIQEIRDWEEGLEEPIREMAEDIKFESKT